MRTLLCLAAAAGLGSLTLHAADDPPFTPLFNGKDLTGWTAFGRLDKAGPTMKIDPKQTWSVVGGELHGTGTPTGYLATDKEYSDYVLKLKWRYPAGLKAGNSGVLLHCQRDDRVWPLCYEAQLRSGRAGDLWLQPDERGTLPTLDVDPARRDAADKTMRHIWRAPKDEEVEKPFGQWNEYEITCKGGDIKLVVNGKPVNEGKKASLTKGRIAVQAEGTEIHFKDIVISAR